MIPVDLALALRAAGLVWEPAEGDCFVVPDRDLDGEVFRVSEMVVSQVEQPDGGSVLAFNGTTEWALDSLEVAEALWLPREDQLRERLGDRFSTLQRVDGAAGGYVVTLADSGADSAAAAGGETGVADWHADTSPAAAYARALLAVLAGTA